MTRAWPLSTDSWLDPRLEIRPSRLHGRGTFAVRPIPRGEVVTVWAHRVLSEAELVAAPAGRLSPRGVGRWLWQPPDDPEARDYLLNHSCDPNLGMADEITLVTRRPVPLDEELTIDYAMFELDPAWVSRFACKCGASSCRVTISGGDWQRPELQVRYAGHFHPALAARIAAHA